jgi:hypothetical protein
MSITLFSKPSDNDILKKIEGKNAILSFVGKGSIHQSNTETIYIRTIRFTSGKKETLRNVIFIKKGISWLFKNVEEVA